MTDKWSYSTPYGRWTAQRQPSGVWAAAYRAGPAGLPGGEFEATLRRWSGIDDAGLPRLHSVAAEDRQVKWVLPPHANWTPLATVDPLAVDDTRWLVREVGGLLEAMHHGRAAAIDLAPTLVLVDRAGRRVTVLPTLGLDRQAAAAPDGVTRMPFVAPEVGGAGPVDPARADVYGLGSTAYFLLTGRPPFPGTAAEAMTERQLRGVPAPSAVRPGIPPELDALVQKMGAKDPPARFQTADEVVTALHPWLPVAEWVGLGLPLARPAAETPAPRQTPPPDRSRGGLTGTLARLIGR